jgi:porin
LTVGIIDADNKILHAGWDTAFDGFDSLMIFFETGLRSRIPSKRGPLGGNYRFGVLLDPRDRVTFSTQGVSSPQTDSGDVGVYASLDQMLVPEQDDASQGLGVFFRWGHRTPDVNRISDFWSTGLQYRGLLQGRNEDLMGLALYSVSGSGDYRTFLDPGFERETGCEVYYSFQLTPWLTFSPDFQFIDNPGARESVRDAMVFGFRTRVTF